MDTDGRIRERTDSLEEFAELLAQGSGHYDVRLDADDAPSPVVSISVDVARGLTRRIRLSFEKPDNAMGSSLGSFERRHPSCAPLLAGLTTRYGRPLGPKTTVEELLQDHAYSWATPSEELALHCGQYLGRRTVFAMEVVIGRPSRG